MNNIIVCVLINSVTQYILHTQMPFMVHVFQPPCLPNGQLATSPQQAISISPHPLGQVYYRNWFMYARLGLQLEAALQVTALQRISY